jgi:hypothetical protein
MRETVLLLMMIACGPAAKNEPVPPTGDTEYSFRMWVSDYKADIPAAGLVEISKIVERSLNINPAVASKIVGNLHELQYIKESDNLDSDITGAHKRLGVCFFGGGRSVGINVLNRSGFETFNKDYFGDQATEQTLNASQSFVWLHELGHCLGDLSHSSAEGILVMQPYVGYTQVSEFITDEQFFLDELIEAIGKGSAGLWYEDVDTNEEENFFE